MTDNVTSAGQPGRLAALWSVLANWRDWSLPVKLAAVTLVPVIFAIVLGAMQITDQIDKAGSYRAGGPAGRGQRRAALADRVACSASAPRRVVLLAARASDIEPETVDERRATDAARASLMRAAGRVTLDDGVTAAALRRRRQVARRAARHPRSR